MKTLDSVALALGLGPAQQWASSASGPLRWSDFRDERAMRFQLWVNESTWSVTIDKAKAAQRNKAYQQAWLKYQDHYARITTSCGRCPLI